LHTTLGVLAGGFSLFVSLLMPHHELGCLEVFDLRPEYFGNLICSAIRHIEVGSKSLVIIAFLGVYERPEVIARWQ
jgi:hypothetical protein